MDAITLYSSAEPGGDVAKSDFEQHGRLLLRFAEGPRTNLHWQAGVTRPEHRSYVDRAMMGSGRFDETVVIFHLLGAGATREQALMEARRNPNGR